MGGLCSNSSASPEDKAARKQNMAVEKQLAKDRKVMAGKTKLLLLGTGESGKSTIFKQMKIISIAGGFTVEELVAYRFVILGNCISQMKILIHAALRFDFPFDSESNKERAARIKEMPADPEAWTPEIGRHIQELWNDSAVRQAYALRDKAFQLDDSTEYMDRIIAMDYVPSPQDVLRARVRSCGIQEAEFDFEDITFQMIDVGGQRSERRKWIHCFEGITAVIFCVAMSEYDQTLREEDTMNRMKESLLLWEEICNSRWFSSTTFILFMNKMDIFAEKIRRIDLSVLFPDYEGGLDEEEAKSFLKAKFLQKNRTRNQVFTHFTVAVDTQNICFVFKVVRETLMKELLRDVNLF